MRNITFVTPHLVRCPACVNSVRKLSTLSPGSPPPATFPGPRSQCMLWSKGKYPSEPWLAVLASLQLRSRHGCQGLALGRPGGCVFQGCRTGQLSLLTRPSEPAEGPFCSVRGAAQRWADLRGECPPPALGGWWPCHEGRVGPGVRLLGSSHQPVSSCLYDL